MIAIEPDGTLSLSSFEGLSVKQPMPNILNILDAENTVQLTTSISRYN